MELYQPPAYRSHGMSITRERPTAAPITDDFFREYMKISHGKQGAVIQNCINAAEAAIFEKGGRAILEQSIKITFEQGNARARFPAFPVKKIDAVRIVNPETGSTVALTENEDYMVLTAVRDCLELNRPTTGRLEIDITGGYAQTPDEVDPEHRYLIANLAGAYYLRDNVEIEKQLNTALASLANL